MSLPLGSVDYLARGIIQGPDQFAQSTFSAFGFFEFARPNDNDLPPLLLELLVIALVASHVLPELFQPKLLSCARSRGPFASLMPMPKTTVNKDGGLVFRQHQVRFSGKAGCMKTKAKP